MVNSSMKFFFCFQKALEIAILREIGKKVMFPLCHVQDHNSGGQGFNNSGRCGFLSVADVSCYYELYYKMSSIAISKLDRSFTQSKQEKSNNIGIVCFYRSLLCIRAIFN